MSSVPIAATSGQRAIATPHPRRRTVRRGNVLAYAALAALSAAVLLPLSWMLTAALKPAGVPVFTVPPAWFPTDHWAWDNFRRALFDEGAPFARYALNSLVIVVGTIVGTMVSCAPVAYAFARLRFRGRDVLFNVLIVTMLIPWQSLIIPQFLIYHRIGWYGTFLPLIVPSWFGTAFSIFLIRQYMRTFPRDLDDAARIDGAGYFRIFWDIILPLSRPVLVVASVFTFLGSWSDLLGPLIYLDRNEMFTVAVGLANMVQRFGTEWNLVMAANLVAILPVLVVYYFAQDKLIGGIASVGLKG
jgi:multiple sugar transport system permease protein